MRHRKRTNRLGRTSAHCRAMLRNLVCSLIKHERVKTSKARAKAARSLADKVVHLALTGDDHKARRRVFKLLSDKEAVKRLFDEVAGNFSKNNGGYTRIVPYGVTKGDSTEMVYFTFAYDVVEKEASGETRRFRFNKERRSGQPRRKKKSRVSRGSGEGYEWEDMSEFQEGEPGFEEMAESEEDEEGSEDSAGREGSKAEETATEEDKKQKEDESEGSGESKAGQEPEEEAKEGEKPKADKDGSSGEESSEEQSEDNDKES